MIRITVELISARGPARNTVLGVATIANDGTGTELVGNYKAEFSQKAPNTNKVWRRGSVSGFPRKQRGAWDLIYLVLHNALGGRNRPLPPIIKQGGDTQKELL